MVTDLLSEEAAARLVTIGAIFILTMAMALSLLACV